MREREKKAVGKSVELLFCFRPSNLGSFVSSRQSRNLRQTDGADSSSDDDERQTEKHYDDGVEAFLVRRNSDDNLWDFGILLIPSLVMRSISLPKM